MAAKQILDKGVRKTIGSGADTKVWEDVWIPGEPARPAKPRFQPYDPDLKVHHLIDYDHKIWNENLVREFVAEEDVSCILSMRISKTGRKDSYIWKYSKSGSDSVRTGYRVAVE